MLRKRLKQRAKNMQRTKRIQMRTVELLNYCYRYLNMDLNKRINPRFTELLIKSYISMSFICSIFTPENSNIQSFVNEGDDNIFRTI